MDIATLPPAAPQSAWQIARQEILRPFTWAVYGGIIGACYPIGYALTAADKDRFHEAPYQYISKIRGYAHPNPLHRLHDRLIESHSAPVRKIYAAFLVAGTIMSIPVGGAAVGVVGFATGIACSLENAYRRLTRPAGSRGWERGKLQQHVINYFNENTLS